MDRIASLVLRASELRRRIYCSIPFEIRLAAFFTKIADKIEEWGRAIGAEFLVSGVTDMPDPGPKWNPKAPHPYRTLPIGYMREFSNKLFGTVKRKLKDEDLVTEAIQTYVAKMLTRHPIKPVTRTAAESYVIDGCVKAGLSIIRSQRGLREDSLDAPGGGDEEATALIDELATPGPTAFEELQRAMSPRIWKQLMEFIARNTHQDMPVFISLSLEGYNNDEIIGDEPSGKPGMLPHYKPSKSGYRGSPFYRLVRKIPDLVGEFFQRHPGEIHAPV